VQHGRIPTVIRVTCKLHNFLVERNEEYCRTVEVARGDARRGDVAAVLYTDGTGTGNRGRRSDLEESDTRLRITNYLKDIGVKRPEHAMAFCRVRRI